MDPRSSVYCSTNRDKHASDFIYHFLTRQAKYVKHNTQCNYCCSRSDSIKLDQINSWVRALAVLKHLGLKMDPLYPTMILVKGTLFLYQGFRWLTGLLLLPFQDQEKEAKICMSKCCKGFTLTHNVGWGFICSTPTTWRTIRLPPWSEDVFSR